MNIKLTALAESVKSLSDEELRLAESGLHKMLAVVEQEKRQRRRVRKNKKSS